MSVLTCIRGRFLSVIKMSEKPSLNVRFSNAILKEIDELIEKGDYASRSDFINRAVAELLLKEGFRPTIREEIEKMKKR